MHKLYELKELLMEQLEKDADEGLNANNLHEIDTLTHALKNLCKVIECCGDDRGSSYGRMYRDDYSSRRDSMGRYARAAEPEHREDAHGYGGDVVDQLEKLMVYAADERTKGKFRELIRDMRNR